MNAGPESDLPFFSLLLDGWSDRGRLQPGNPTESHRTMNSRQRALNVLFLCTGNSARSIIAESILRQQANGRFNAYSAGSRPAGTVNPFALELLRANRMPTDGLESKSWERFTEPGAPPLDFVITVCDNAAGEVCPVWPGQPITAHWGVPDPAAVDGSDEAKRMAFSEACRTLANRIRLFTSLPLARLDRLSLQQRLRDIGNTGA
jgi:arsenate reductase